MSAQKLVSTTIPAELCEQLEVLAEEACRTRAGYLRQLIKAYLQNLEQHPEQKIT